MKTITLNKMKQIKMRVKKNIKIKMNKVKTKLLFSKGLLKAKKVQKSLRLQE